MDWQTNCYTGEPEVDPWADPSKQHEQREWCKARGRFNKQKIKINKCKLSETRGIKLGNREREKNKNKNSPGGEQGWRRMLESRAGGLRKEFTGAGTGIRGLRSRGRNAG